MTLDEFQDLLDTHGGDLNLWPFAAREEALALLEENDNAIILHQEALELDALLQGEPAPKPNLSAMNSLFEDVARHAEAELHQDKDTLLQPVLKSSEPPSFAERLLDLILRPAYALGASAALGVVIGVWDIWLEPTSEASILSEFVFSALPM